MPIEGPKNETSEQNKEVQNMEKVENLIKEAGNLSTDSGKRNGKEGDFTINAELTEKDIEKGVKKVHMSFGIQKESEGPNKKNREERKTLGMHIIVIKEDANGKTVGYFEMRYSHNSKPHWAITAPSGDENKLETRKTNMVEEELLDEINKRIQFTKQKKLKDELENISKNEGKSDEKDLENSLESNLKNLA